ncbi:MAG: MMPL family transporter [Planctomycetota bacterium]
MFQWLGNFVTRFWLYILAAWIAAVLAGWFLAPPWESVTRSGEIAFLPPSAPSRQAEEFFKKAFPEDYAAGSVALVFAREKNELEEGDRLFVEKTVVPAVSKMSLETDSPITNIRHLGEEGVGSLLVSADKKATIVLIEVSTPFQDPRNVPLVAAIEKLANDWTASGQAPAGLTIAVTGSATAGRDLDLAEAAGARTIERWTIAIVIIILVLLYRAPLVAIIPLLTVFISVEVSVRLLGFLAGHGIFAPSRDLRVFVTVLAYGAGVDYCLFLVARYREELHNGIPPDEALSHSISRVGAAITASAGTVIGGIGMLAFARFGKIHEAGLVIPLALTIALVATLTFTGSLLRLTGPRAFWPQRIKEDHGVNIWDTIGPLLVKHAGVVFIVFNLVLAPFAILGIVHYHDLNFNPLSDLPRTAPSRIGSELLERHFPTGTLGPVTMLIGANTIDFQDPKNDATLRELTARLTANQGSLGLADVRSLTQPLGLSAAGREKLAMLEKNKLQEDARIKALRFYVSAAEGTSNHVTRIDLTLTGDPLNRDGIAALERIQKEIPLLLPRELQGATIEFAGSTASLRDLSDIKKGDQQLIQILVSSIVLVLLIIILRRVVVSVYLVVSVLLSYLATLGLTDLVFRSLEPGEFNGLDWKVPIFLFTILVAVGEDYNIFLLTRVKEEQDDFGPIDAIPHALSRTGKVISSCGFVMAGTFASLLSGSLLAMKQLGFALSVGVLLDTLVVRPILVPTFLILLQRWFGDTLGGYMALGHWKRDDLKAKEPIEPS